MKRSFNFMSVFIVFAIFLLNFQVIMATDGAGGSGKPVVIKLRKDYFEERIKMDMQDKIDENPVTAEIPVGPLSFTANLKMSIKNVLFSRGLMAEGLSNLGNENALRYRVLIFGSVEIESITGSVSNDILDSYKKYYNQLLMSYRYKIKASDMEFYGNDKILEYMDTPNFILKGYFRPVTDEAGRLNEDTYILEFEDFQINDLNNTTAIEGMVLNKFKEFESESIFSIEGMNDELEGRNPFLKISMPGIFETESTMIGMDHCDVNGMNCIEYPIPDPPEESFSNNKPDSLVEMRISEDVLYKTIQDEFEAEIVSPMELEELNVNIMNGYLHIQFKLSMKIVLVNCHLMEFNYYYKFDPSTGMPGEDNETGISLKLESHDKNIGSVTPPSLIAFGVCAGAANEIEERFLDKTDTISDGLTENIPTLIDLAKEINMKDYEIEAGFEVGNNFRDVVLSLIKPVPEKEKYIYNFNWAFSDDNENGIQNINDRCWYADWINGEDCDIDGDGIKDHVDQKAYKAESTVNPSEIDGAQYDENCIEMTGGNFHIKNCDFEKDVHYGEYFDLEGSLYMKNGTVSDKPSAYLSSFYCYCGKDNDRRKDCSTGGTCGQHHGNPGELSNSFYGKNTWQPMYDGISSGRDNRFYEKDKYDKKISLATGVYAKKTYGKWQWQKDLADVYGVFKLPEWDMKKIYQTTGRKYNEKDYHLFYLRDFNASRTSFAPSRNKFNSGNNYIITKNAGTANETKELNPKYFENYFVSGNNTFNTMQQAATNSKWSNSMPFYLYMIKWKDRVASRSIDIDGYWIYYPYEWLNDFLNPWLIDKTGPVENGGMPLTTNPGYIFDTVLTPDTMLLQKVYTNKNSQQTFKSPQGYLSYSFEDGKYIISPAVSSAYESEGKEVLRGVDLKGASFINYNGSIFAEGNLISRTQMKSAYSEDIDTVYDDYSYNNIFVKINEDGENYELRPLAYIPEFQPAMLKLFIMDMELNLVTFNRSGMLRIFRYYSENDDWSEIGSLDMGSDRTPSMSSLKVVDGSAFFTVLDSEGTHLYKFNSGTGIENVIKISDDPVPFSKIAGFDSAVIFADMKKMKEGRVTIYSFKDGALNQKETDIKMINFNPQSYDEMDRFCIYENSGSIFPGTINNFGICIPVYDYDYETVSYFDYKYTVAGYNNNIYLGGLTGVRRVEVKEDGALSNKEMLYTGETNNLAIYRNTMYGANYSEVDVFSISQDGSISRISGISASSCKNVRINNGRLFTAENKKVRVFDLTDPQSPQLVKTIATAGTVIDLEVVGNTLYIYEETTSWFTTKGFTGIYDISDITSPVRTKYFEKRCTDAEMQKSGPSTGSGQVVYLGCKNGQYRIEETGLKGITGEKNFVREGYVYDNVLYQVFAGALHKSKTAERISVCGDGEVENDEICDGDIVQCSSISSSYIGGIAACNSTCDGYNESVCETDGW